MAREPRRIGTGATIIVVMIILALIAATGYVVWLSVDLVNQKADLPTEPALILPTAAETEAAEEETECVCGRSTDGRCHCCSCNTSSIPVIEEDIDLLNDWD